MSDDTLNQEELESLLRGAEGDEVGHEDTPRVLPFTEAQGEETTAYDFRRPEPSGDLVRTLQTLHEGLAPLLADRLSTMVRDRVDVKFVSVDRLSYGKFIARLEDPTCLNVLSAETLEGPFLLDVDLAILHPLIDRLLGGGAPTTERRPLTEIEHRLVGRITGLFLGELQRAWEDVIPLKLAVTRVASNPQRVQALSPSEGVALTCFELTLGEQRAPVHLAIPEKTVAQVRKKLGNAGCIVHGPHLPTPDSIDQVGRNLCGSLVELNVRLAATRLTTEDLFGLQVGDIITTDKDAHSPLTASVEGVPKFHASAGAYQGRKAIRIEQVLNDPSD